MTPKQARVYSLDRELTEEQVAVTFAMTSRSPEPFDEIAKQVSETRAAEFHERWVWGYGHASVAEHAVIHIAMENISRVAADAVESNRLASYTEKSSRYQIIAAEDFHRPTELDHSPALRQHYEETMRTIFGGYDWAVKQFTEHLEKVTERRENETERQRAARIRRLVTDSARALLPAAALTNVGMTANARTMAHAITKLLSDELTEHRLLGDAIKETATATTPTLLKYADPNEQVRLQRRVSRPPERGTPEARNAILLSWDDDAASRVLAGMRFPDSGGAARVGEWKEPDGEREAAAAIARELEGRRDHDPLPRALERARYSAELILDYGALREARRHRMLTPICQPLRTAEGWTEVRLFYDAGQAELLAETAEKSESLYDDLAEASPALAQYAVLHAHRQRLLIDVNLRELAELLRLRTSERAHEAIRIPCADLERQVRAVHPELAEATLGPAT